MKTAKDRRIELHDILCKALGSSQCYYNPPSNLKLKYPCIVYSRDDIKNDFADNNVYLGRHRYQVTVIDENPDSDAVENVSKIKTADYARHYVADNLNHDVFAIYY